MTDIEKAWPKYPGYRIDVIPIDGRVRVTHGDLVLAESDRCVRVEESNHVDRIYVPVDDVNWDLFEATETTSVCPFKGEASYWSLTASEPPLVDVVWAYREPFEEVAGIAGHVCFYQHKVDIDLQDPWPEPGAGPHHRLPVWGDQDDLVRLVDAQPEGAGRYVAPPRRFMHPDVPDLRGQGFRNVVEGGQLLGAAIAAAWKELPEQRVAMATLNFIRAAGFDTPLELDVDVLRKGRTFSTSEVRITQAGALCSAGILLHDSGADDVMRHVAPMPDVDAPESAVPIDFGISGRDMRVVDAAYDDSTDRLGPPEIYTWCRYRDAPDHQYLHAALMVQSTTHWTVAASMRPHAGIGEAAAHDTLATGPMTTTVWLLDDVDVTDWLLYANPSPWSGRGLSQGEGRVFTRDGRLVATYGVQAMVRSMHRPAEDLGGWKRAM